MKAVVTLSQTHRDKGEMLSTNHASEKAENRQGLMKKQKTLGFLHAMVIPLMVMVQRIIVISTSCYLRALDDPNLLTCVQKKAEKYTSPEIQNELLKTMTQTVTWDIAFSLGSSGFTPLWLIKSLILSTYRRTSCYLPQEH